MLMLAIPMWIEAAHACRDGIPTSPQQLDIAMRGGLGYQAGWLEFFDATGSQRMLDIIQRHSSSNKSLRADPQIITALQRHLPTPALDHFARFRLEQSA
jgi:3-hydroxyacyl-CoA dehydrogenase